MARRPRTPRPPPGPRFDWTDSPRVFPNADKADPNEIGRSLDEIARAHGGSIQPQNVVDAARAERHPLHRYFEWNDERAAELHRLDTARRLCRSVVLLPDDPGSNVPPRRAWISIPDDETSYRRVTAILDNANLQYLVMKRALSDLESWLKRYQMLQDICSRPVAQAAQQLATQLEAMAAAARARAQAQQDEEEEEATV